MYPYKKRYEKASMKTDAYDKAFFSAVEWLKNFKVQTNNLLLLGDCGVGKTYLLYGFMNDLASQCKNTSGIDIRDYVWLPDVSYTTLKGILDGIRAEWNTKERGELTKYLSTVELLIIDEIGLNYGTESERIELFDIINNRYDNELPTVFVSNLQSRQEIEQKLGRRLTDRIFGSATVVVVKGKSKR